MKTFLSIILLIFFGGIANFATVFVLNLAGLPGALIAIGNPSLSRKIVGSIISIVGQSYIYLAFVVFVVNWTAGAARRDDVLGFPLWPIAFGAVMIPVWRCLMAAREEAREDGRAYNVQDIAIHSSFLTALLGFFVFAFIPSTMKLLWDWVPYVR